MAIKLPDAISAYFAADKGRDADAVSRCFTENAIVKDEGNTYEGRDAIREWKTKASTEYTYTVEPFEIKTQDETTIVTSHVAGDFPGSPVDLRYFFQIESGAISHLEIIV